LGSGTELFVPSKTTGFDKFKVAFPPDKFPKFSFTPDEVMDLLLATNLYSEEVAAILTGIARRESNFRPAAINGNRQTKDFSLGLFQINFLPGAHGSKNFLLKYPSEQTVLGYKLAYSVDDDTNPASLAKKVQDLASLSTVDQRMFIPFNQAIAVGITATNYDQVVKRLKSNQKFDSYIFGPWGDYKGGAGFIFRVSFNIIESVYTAKGKNINTLKNWIRTKFKGDAPYPYIERWMEGTMFNIDGSVYES
jgi:hypothetical protein